MKWNITIHQDGCAVERTVHLIDGGPAVPLFAKLLSQSVKGTVTIGAMARHRQIYKDGKLIKDWPSLDHFYSSGISTQEKHEWAEMM